MVYGLGFFSLDEEPVVIQVPDFGDRFWIYALYDARTDQFAQIGKPYATKPGFYLLAGPKWNGAARRDRRSGPQLDRARQRHPARLHGRHQGGPGSDPAGDRPDRRLSAHGLRRHDEDDGWSEAPEIPGPKSEGGGETAWVVPEKYFDQLETVLDTVAPLPGEEAMYAQFRALIAAAKKDPAVKQAMVEAAVETERDVIAHFLEWKRNGRPAGNGWNRSINNARFGVDYFDRTGTAKSNMFDKKPTETQ